MVSWVALLSLCAIAAAQAPAPSVSVDPTATELAQRAAFPPEAVAFTFPTASTETAAGVLPSLGNNSTEASNPAHYKLNCTIRNMDLGSNPFLGTLPNGGIAQNVDAFAACTINVPHVHPRASEIYYVISGTLEAGIQEEATTGRFINVNITAGQNVVVPQGLLHYVQNNGCEPVQLLQIWNNADPGTVVAWANIVGKFPDHTLAAFTGLDAAAIATVRAAVPEGGSIVQSQACLATCAAATGAAGRRLM